MQLRQVVCVGSQTAGDCRGASVGAGTRLLLLVHRSEDLCGLACSLFSTLSSPTHTANLDYQNCCANFSIFLLKEGDTLVLNAKLLCSGCTEDVCFTYTVSANKQNVIVTFTSISVGVLSGAPSLQWRFREL